MGTYRRKYFQAAGDDTAATAAAASRVRVVLVVEHSPMEAAPATVPVERPTTEKRFIGGFRDKTTGVEYHHADVQTEAAQTVGAAGRASWGARRVSLLTCVRARMPPCRDPPGQSPRVLSGRRRPWFWRPAPRRPSATTPRRWWAASTQRAPGGLGG